MDPQESTTQPLSPEIQIEVLNNKLSDYEEQVTSLKKALDIALKNEPVFVYEHCGHCPKK
jgi:hypothetical protein